VKIKTCSVDYGGRVGTFELLANGRVRGKPFPSEGQAWAFSRGVDVLGWFIALSYEQQLVFLKKRGI
jgi:hypothetical protein